MSDDYCYREAEGAYETKEQRIERLLADLKAAADDAEAVVGRDIQARQCCLCGAVEAIHRMEGTKSWVCDSPHKVKEVSS